MATTSDIQTLARAFLNDSAVAAGDVFLDAVLLPFVQSSYRDLQRRLAERGITVLIAESDLALAADVTILTDSSTPALPTGFIVPHSLREKPTAGSEKFKKMAKHTDGLPDIEQVNFLNMWEWRDNAIQFVGSTRAMTVKVRYEKQLADLTQSGGGATILIRGAEEALALRTAMMAASSRGSAAAVGFLTEYLSEVLRMARRFGKPEQRKSRRRMPYGFRNYHGQQRY